jgi:SAM-dependent methyltransferase
MPLVLHVGCGLKDIRSLPAPFRDGRWREIRLDISPANKPDVIGTMTDMKEVPTGSVHAVFSSHNIEHLYDHEVPLALSEFRRVLKPSGFAVITCPDLQGVAALIAADKLAEPAYHSPSGPITPLDILYGHRAAVAQGNHFMAHKTGFTARTLVKALTDAGFARVAATRRPGPSFDLWALATRDAPPQEELTARAQAMFPSPGRRPQP